VRRSFRSARVTAIVVAYNGGEALARCVSALRTSVYRDLDVVVVDNASSDDSIALLESRGVDVLRLPENRGFAGGVNAGIAYHVDATGGADIYALVNQDCLVTPGWLGALVVTLLADAGVAVAGARLYASESRVLEHAGARVAANGLTAHIGRGAVDARPYDVRADVDYVTGALCAFTRETWRRHGPFDEGFFPAYFEEVDFCLRCRREGGRVVYVPESEGVHTDGGVLGVGSHAFLAAYHAGRVRFVVNHLLVRGTLLRTLWAEATWLLSLRHPREIIPVLVAYLALPRLLHERRVRRREARHRRPYTAAEGASA
jgi:GT2 family glycosyltransferase